MNFTYSSYDLAELPEELLLVTSTSASTIKSKKLANFLKVLKKREATFIPEKTLNQYLSTNDLKKSEALDFLKEAIELKPLENTLYFEKVLIIHDWKDKREIEIILKDELKCEFEIFSDPAKLIMEASEKTCYIIMIHREYNYSKIKSLYFELADTSPESGISIAHFSGNIFFIDQPYIASIGNPCHFCRIDRQLHYEKFSSSPRSWSSLLKFCIERNINFPMPKLGLLQRNLALGGLVKKTMLHTERSKTFRYQENALCSLAIDLDNGLITENSTPHWHSCTCLRANK